MTDRLVSSAGPLGPLPASGHPRWTGLRSGAQACPCWSRTGGWPEMPFRRPGERL